MRRLNFVYLLALVVLGVAAAGGAYLIHGWQLRRQGPAILARAQALEAGGDVQKAAESYRMYLALEPEDGDVWRRYAQASDQASAGKSRDGRVYLLHEQALRVIGEDEELERRCIDLALELERYGDARRRLEPLIKRLERASAESPALAGLEERMGRCHEAERKFAEAERWYRRSIERAPGRVAVREALAGLLRRDLKLDEAADAAVEEMVAAADRPAEALAARWRHQREFGLEADPRDAAKALELEPENPDVLLVAARAALDAHDLDLALERLAKGSRLAPGDRAFPMLAARLESAAGRPDRAEALLREAVKAIPDDLEVQLVLVESLIAQGKLDGDDGAGAWTARLASGGLAEGYVRFLEAQALIQRGRWREALGTLGTARALLAKDSATTGRVELLLAECHARLGGEEESVAALRRAVEKEGAGIGPRLLLAGALEKAGRIEEAVRIHRELQADRPESRLDEVRLLILQQAAEPVADRAWGGVEERLKAAEAALPEHSETLSLLRAEMLAARDRRAEATALLEAASRREPDRLSYRLALAALALRGGEAADPRAAMAILDRAEKDLGAKVEVRLARIDAAAALPFQEARARLDGLAGEVGSAAEADRPDLLDRLASAYYRIGGFDKAAELLTELGKARPGDLKVLLARADAALARNDQARIREIVGLIKEIEGDQGLRWRYVEASGLVLRLAGEPSATRPPLRAAADALVRDLIDRRKDWWGGPLLRGRLAELDGRLDDAAGDYAKAIEAGASQPELARRTVMLLSELGRAQESDEIARLLALRDPNFEGLRLSEAQNALRNGEYDRAVALTRKIIPETSRNPLDLLFLARVLSASGRRAEAEKPLLRALEAAPPLGAVWIAWARHLAESGRIAEVPAVLDRAAKAVDPKAAPLTLAAIRSAVGDDAGAAPLFASAVKAAPDDLGTIRAAAEFYVKVLDVKAARPLVDRLLDPTTAAGPEAVAWARRASALLAVSPGDRQRIDQAIALVDENLQTNPLAPDDRRARAILLTMHPDRRDDGLRELEALHARRRLGREDRFLLARLYDERGDQAKWRATMAELLAEPEPELAHVLTSVRREIELGDPAAASKSLGLARPQGPEAELAVLEARCRLYQAEKRDAEIPALVEAQAKDRPDQLGGLAFLLESLGFQDEAERSYRGFASKAPDDPTRKLVLAQFLARRDRFEEALAQCEAAAASAPPALLAAVVTNLLGNAKALKPEVEAGLARLVERSASLASDEPGALLQLALLRSRQRRYEEAERVYDRILSIAPDDVAALNDFAWLLGSLEKDLDRAKRLVDRALELIGPESSPLDTRAMIHLKRKETAAALQDIDAAIALAPRKATLHARRAEALLMAQRPDEARESLKKAEDLGIATVALSPDERDDLSELTRRLK